MEIGDECEDDMESVLYVICEGRAVSCEGDANDQYATACYLNSRQRCHAPLNKAYTKSRSLTSSSLYCGRNVCFSFVINRMMKGVPAGVTAPREIAS